MLPGRWIYQVIPAATIATHCSVNRLAYQLIRDQAPSCTIPRPYLINFFEGLNGVDGLWLNNRHLPSRSTYNPITQEGRGLAEVSHQHAALVQALQQRRRRRITKRLAYLAHIITDVCTPPHQHGRSMTVRTRRWYMIWHVHDDWVDEAEEKYVVHRHSLFEMQSLFRVRSKAWGQLQLDQAFITAYQQQTQPSDFVREYVRSKVEQIRQLDIYARYLEQGWSESTTETMTGTIIPTIITTVASVWCAALKRYGLPRHSSLPIYK